MWLCYCVIKVAQTSTSDATRLLPLLFNFFMMEEYKGLVEA